MKQHESMKKRGEAGGGLGGSSKISAVLAVATNVPDFSPRRPPRENLLLSWRALKIQRQRLPPPLHVWEIPSFAPKYHRVIRYLHLNPLNIVPPFTSP